MFDAGTATTLGCVYKAQEDGGHRYASSGVVPGVPVSVGAPHIGFRFSSDVDGAARFAAPEMTSRTASPAVDGGRVDAPPSGLQSHCNQADAARSSDIYDISRHHKRLSTHDKSDDVIKNANKTDASPLPDRHRVVAERKMTEDVEIKHEVRKLQCFKAIKVYI